MYLYLQAKLALVGDNPGVKLLAWHSVVALLGTAPPTKCVNHEFSNTQLPEKFTRCSVHSPQRVAIRTKSCKANSRNKPKNDLRTRHRQRKSNGWPRSTISYEMYLQNIAAVFNQTQSTTCTPFTKLSETFTYISPP